MSNPGNGQSFSYNVQISSQIKTIVRQLHRQAIQQGTGAQFLAAFREAVDRLRREPLIFGEPLYRLPALQLQVRQAVLLPLVVDFAVHETRPLVLIRGFKVLS